MKIADLGFSKQLSNIEEVMYTYCGTPLSMAPEIMNNMPYTYKANYFLLHIVVNILVADDVLV